MKRIGIHKQEGQSMVEFIIVAPFLFMLIFGIIQFGILFHDYLALTDAVRVGARQAAVSRLLPDPAGAATDRTELAADPSLDLSKVEILVTPYDPATNTATFAQNGNVTVSARYPYSIHLFGLPIKLGWMTSETTERVE
jgi:Flp pilus assembly protein TadG